MTRHLKIVASAGKPKPAGRYGGGAGAHMPSNGVARPTASLRARTGVAVVPDPMEPGRDLLATVNRTVDVLELERSRGRISESAYQTGREIQAVYEAAARLNMPARSFMGGDRVDAPSAHETSIAKQVRAGKLAAAVTDEIRKVVGSVGERFMRALLVEGQTFASYAEGVGRGGKHAVGMVADRFRWMLEAVATSREAVGAGHRSRAEALEDF